MPQVNLRPLVAEYWWCGIRRDAKGICDQLSWWTDCTHFKLNSEVRINTLYEHAISSHMKGAQQQTRRGSLYKRMTSYFLPVGALCFRVCFHAVGAKKRKGGGKIHCCIVMHFAAQRPVRLPTFLLKESSWQHALDEKHTSFLLGKSFAGITLLNRNVCVQASARVSATLFYEHPRDEVFVQYICKYRHTYTH